MGTLVGQRYGLGRNYTGSLVELNNCGYSTNTCEDQFDDMKSSTEQSWSSEPSDLSVPFWMSTSGRTFDAYEAHLETSSLLNTFALDVRDFSGSSLVSEKSDVQNTKHLLGVTQLIGLSRLMKFIMHKSRQWNTNDNMSENPHSSSFTDYIFAQAQLKQKARRRGHYPILQTFSHSSSLNASLTCIAEPKYTGSNGQCTQNLLETFTYTRCKRRHYNSESGLFLPEANFTVTQHQNEKKSECESDSRLSKDILSSGYPEEANCSMLPTDINTNDTNSEVAVSQNECQENYLLSGEREIDALTVNAIENFAQCLPETVSEGSTCSDQLQEMNSLPNLTKSNDSTVNQITLHDEHQVFTNNLSDKSIVATSQSKLDLKLIKSVSFADEIGKSLTETFIVYDEDCYDEPPECDELYEDSYFGSDKQQNVQNSQNKRSKFEIFYGETYLQCDQNTKVCNYENAKTFKHLCSPDIEPHYTWSLTFTQPASQYYEFRQKLEQNSVSLESISIAQSTDKPRPTYIKLSGTIKVKNIFFEKSVHLRLTKDNWKTFTNYEATYSAQLSSGTWSGPRRYDTFIFSIMIEPDKEYFDLKEKIEFAICFSTVNNDQRIEYWDNYDNKNYIIEQRRFHPLWINATLTNNSIELSSPSSDASISPVSETPLDNNLLNITDSSCATCYNTSSYTLDCRPNFDSFTSFTDYRAWSHYSGETNYY